MYVIIELLQGFIHNYDPLWQDIGQESGGEADEEIEESDDEHRRMIDLEVLSKDPHPSLTAGSFSVYNSQRVGPAKVQDVSYDLDMDGFVVLSQ